MIAASFLVFFVLFFDPWELHPIDSWLQGHLDYQLGGVEMASEGSTRELWTCSMHPHILEDEPATARCAEWTRLAGDGGGIGDTDQDPRSGVPTGRSSSIAIR